MKRLGIDSLSLSLSLSLRKSAPTDLYSVLDKSLYSISTLNCSKNLNFYLFPFFNLIQLENIQITTRFIIFSIKNPDVSRKTLGGGMIYPSNSSLRAALDCSFNLAS
ncbi:MAG: hypothetical protein HY769_10430 [Candidatus Stahlbacteria bacterium]|nr:hypothetical protein [Candidatus Stahlbacteria bacterium]